MDPSHCVFISVLQLESVLFIVFSLQSMAYSTASVCIPIAVQLAEIGAMKHWNGLKKFANEHPQIGAEHNQELQEVTVRCCWLLIRD